MKPHKNFITFEGIDFSGKTTQIELLLEKLKPHGINPMILREPGGTTIFEKIRDIWLSPTNREMFKETEILLYEAARAQLVHQKILPILQKGKFVIADRFFDSTIVYQGYGRGLDMEEIRTINNTATRGLCPNLTILLDLPVDTGFERKSDGRQDRFENEGTSFHERIRQGYLELAAEEPQRWLVIDAGQSKEVIVDIIWQKLSPLLPRRD